MRGRRAAQRAAWMLAAVGTACSSAYSGTETPEVAEPADAEAAAADGSSVATDATLDANGATDAGDDVGPPPLVADAFEVGDTCAPWSATPTTTTENVAGGVTGKACRVCSQDAGGARIILSVDAAGSGTYRAVARLRSEDYVGDVSLEIRFQGEGGTVIGASTAVKPVSGSWKDAVTTATATAAPSSVVLVLTGYSGAGCWLVDDVTLAAGG